MLYIFDVLGEDWIKIGFTAQLDPWIRIANGFWTNIHPVELCGKLGPENLNLIFLFEGNVKLEAVIKSLFPPVIGEFWYKDRLDEIVGMLRLMTEELKIPTRPLLLDISGERLPCCGGEIQQCSECGKTFKRQDKLARHKKEVHEKRGRKRK